MEKKGACPRGAACKWCTGGGGVVKTAGSTITKSTQARTPAAVIPGMIRPQKPGAAVSPSAKGSTKGTSTSTSAKGSSTSAKGSSWSGGGGGWGGGWGMEEMMWAMMSGKGGWGGGKGWAGGKSNYKMDESGGVLGEFLGELKSFNEMTGYGFISCADLAAQGHKDAFLHQDQKRGYQVGHKVKFTAFLTKDGKVQAKDLKSGIK
mmetsp:Transcript_9212/g.23880  ORF Transcript_9212/g.23880 Transcript_9212/m.23880 type:complete len:205 (-) Transcript_9212:80-694(-)